MRGIVDERGEVYPSPADWYCHFAEIRNVHMATLNPGKIRGNHLHKNSKELLIIKHSSSCRLYWMEKGNRRRQSFEGKGAILVQIDPGCPHAILNTGTEELTILSLQELAYDPASPDMVKVELATAEDLQSEGSKI